ncbi:MAG: ArsR/SmtB family transcription factor [Halobacteriota archaeon]
MSDSKIQLDREIMSALSSESRVAILKRIKDRQKTVTELANELDLSKSTVHKHVNKLSNAGLIERIENDSKWVYYRLTKKGKLVQAGKAEAILLLSMSSVAFIGGVIELYLYFVGIKYQAPGTAHDPVYLILGQVLLIVGIVAGYLGYKILKERRGSARLEEGEVT